MAFIELRGSTDVKKSGRHYITYKYLNGKWIQFNDSNVTVVELRGTFKTIFALYRKVSSTKGTYLNLEFNFFNYQTRSVKVFDADVKKPLPAPKPKPPAAPEPRRKRTAPGKRARKGDTQSPPAKTKAKTPDKPAKSHASAQTPDNIPKGHAGDKTPEKGAKPDVPGKTPKKGAKPHAAPKTPQEGAKADDGDNTPDKVPIGDARDKKPLKGSKPDPPGNTPKKAAKPHAGANTAQKPGKVDPGDTTPDKVKKADPCKPNKGTIGPITKRKREHQFMLDLSKIKKEYDTRNRDSDIVTIDLTDSPIPKIKATTPTKKKVVRRLSEHQITEISRGTYITYTTHLYITVLFL